MDEMDLTGMTWYGALVAVIMLMILWIMGKKSRKRFDASKHTASEIYRMVGETVHSERDRKIILRRMIDGIKMERLSEEFELSVPQIKRIVYSAEDALADYNRRK